MQIKHFFKEFRMNQKVDFKYMGTSGELGKEKQLKKILGVWAPKR